VAAQHAMDHRSAKIKYRTFVGVYPVSKRDKMLEGVDIRHQRGIEIGALAAPIVTKAESDIRYVDWADQQTLQAKYAHDPNVNVAKIVPVDAIWGDLSLKESLSGETGFGYAIASHVIEHVPDMIGWLAEIAEVLSPGGRLTLAIPDRRFTFDYLRQNTRAGDLIDAWLRRNRRPAPGSVYDFHANTVVVDAAAAWRGPLDRDSLPHYTDVHTAMQLTREAFEGTYHDVHCWVFTPASLFRILVDLVELDLLPYRCARFHDSEVGSFEMLLILERRAGDTAEEKADARESFLVHLRALEAGETIANAAEEAQRLRETIETFKNRIAVLETETAVLRSSTSWRITEPLRMIKTRISSLTGAQR
jgi:SAM-dependent methyltransferase